MTKTKAAPKAAKKATKARPKAPVKPKAVVTPAAPKPKATVAPIKVDNKTSRSDNDALEGCHAKVVSGIHDGARGTFDEVLESGADGYPRKVILLTRGQQAKLTCDYSDLRPDTAGQR